MNFTGALLLTFFRSAVVGQFFRPTADIATGSWTPSTGTDLFAMLDESTPNDADYITSGSNPANDSAIVGLGGATTPQDGTVTLRVRAKTV